MPTELLSEADVRLLTEIGFLGAGAGVWQHTQSLFEALAKLRPHRDFPYIGLATMQLNLKQVDEAVRTLENARNLLASANEATKDDKAMLAVFHGIALQCAQRSAESQQVLQSVLQMGYHNDALRIARTMLGLKQDKPNALETS